MFETDYSISRDILKTYRFALLVVAIAFPVIGLLTNYYDNEMYDPLTFRVIIGLLTLLLFIGTYLSNIIVKKFFIFFYLLLLIILFWSCFLAFMNDFSFSTTFFYIAAISIVSFSLNSHKYVIVFLILTTILTLYTLYVGEMKPVDGFALMVSIISIQLVAFIIVRWKALTERKLKLYSNELVQNNSDKDKFMQIISHDLRSPISSMLGHTGLLLKNIRKYDFEKVESRVEIIDSIAQNTYTLLDNILMWANSQSGKISLDRQRVGLLDVCLDIIYYFKGSADFKKIEIKCFVDPGIELFADLNMLKTILRNLISNAIKFCNSGGDVTISATENQNTVTVKVADNGMGIDYKVKENLWDFSSTIPSVGTSNEQGSGLGLKLCKDFVERHGGEIWVDSELGEGSVFSFSLPNKLKQNLTAT